MGEEMLTLQDWHKQQAVQCFNLTWNLIDKTDRTRDEDLKMIHLAHASRFHWGEVGTALNALRGEWQIARVYALVAMGESALYHAQHCLELCIANAIGDFDLAFAHEALARAYAVLGNAESKQHQLGLARAAAENIAKPDDREYLLAELQTIC